MNYQPEPAFRNGGCMLLHGTEVKWASGATASVSSLNACANLGYSQVYTFTRPDVPGRDVDMNFALQRQRNAIMLLQALPQAPTYQYQPYQLPPPPAPPRQTTCTTTNVMGTLRTVCN